ncbi:MAG: hypothetical protein HZA50_08930 [Planctomycetes bacterium]|nr:hypothetical protein [Planctomycetota bacterium]
MLPMMPATAASSDAALPSRQESGKRNGIESRIIDIDEGVFSPLNGKIFRRKPSAGAVMEFCRFRQWRDRTFETSLYEQFSPGFRFVRLAADFASPGATIFRPCGPLIWRR